MFRHLVPEARKLRTQQTVEEEILWNELKDRQVREYRFRRQYVIGPYIVDFCCPKLKFIIELDGYPHKIRLQKAKDKARDAYLKDQGYKIVRFWNGEVKRNLNKVVYEIACRSKGIERNQDASPLTRPSPQKGEGV